MFGRFWGRREEAKSAAAGERLLAIPPSVFAKGVEDMFTEDVPAGRAMCIVAYDNLRPISGAMRSAARKAGEKPFVVEDFIELCAVEMQKRDDDVNKRRFAWYFAAAMLGRVDKLARTDSRLVDHAVACWALLAESAPILRVLLPDNIVWKEEEKIWFKELKSEADFVGHVLSHTMPACYGDHPSIVLIAKKYDIFFYRREHDYFPVI
jgi:hypothetical protein